MSEHEETGKSRKTAKKIQLMMDEAQIEAIDAWQFKNRIPTRAKAIRELIRRGLEREAK